MSAFVDDLRYHERPIGRRAGKVARKVAWKKQDPNAELAAWCNEHGCNARGSGTRAELEALKWLPCPRKGGKLEWKCPKCNPLLQPVSTAPGRSAWTIDK